MRIACSHGTGEPARLWDLSLALDLILLVHSQGGVLCELPRKNLVFCGEANYGLECVCLQPRCLARAWAGRG